MLGFQSMQGGDEGSFHEMRQGELGDPIDGIAQSVEESMGKADRKPFRTGTGM